MSEQAIIPKKDVLEAPTSAPYYDAELGYYRGEPWLAWGGTYIYIVPDTPHVHRAFVETANGSGRMQRSEEPVTVLVAHGFADGDGHWIFKDGRSVTEFIDQYNEANPNEPIQMAAVCNPTTENHASTQHSVGTAVGVGGYREGNSTVASISLKDPRNDYMYRPPNQAGS